jgi:uncharacterized protein (UPF0332 family)
MPFDWTLFLAVAQDLAQHHTPENEEAALRCAVSRAYYAAYHQAVAYCESQGRTFSHVGSDHQRVRDHLAVLGRPDEERYLLELHRWRIQADYDDQTSIELKWMWFGARARAASILSALK